MKLLPIWPHTTGSTSPLNVRSLALRPSVDEASHLAFFARMAIYSRSLSPDPQTAPTSAPTSNEGKSSTSISTNTIIAGVLGAVGVLLLCVGVFVAVRIRYRKRHGLQAKSPWSTSGMETACSQKTLCNSKDGFIMAKTAQAGVMKGQASSWSEYSQMESVKEVPIESITMRTHGRRPTIEIDTSKLAGKYRKSSMGRPNSFPERKGGQEMKQLDPPTGPLDEYLNLGDEATNRNSMLSTYTLSLQLSRPSTSLSQISVQTISPIAFCDTPSNSHLPLALRPKALTPSPEEGQPQVDDTKDTTSSPNTLT
ncbi:hypothetical protein D9619_011520 [Psilocybe cf. subviscida]|uniref:Uncharacterized protein n=1 Tax=Psilocybe cf. subviscida TaxID=2480587 RepID=A0A8H5BTJ0_9AGAR|nr:hypothetical protein D9619_011520 [Psilocybe cf. subviscida]